MWVYNKTIFDEIPEGMVGFVYLITNLMNDRKYIGKKNFYLDRKSTRLNSSHMSESRMPSSA